VKHAPLYVAAHDLAVEVARGGGVAGARAVGAALDLVEAVALAVTFPAGRAVQLGRADEAVVRLRVALRIAVDLGERSEGAALALHARLLEVGRMIGGWRRELRRAGRAGPEEDARRAATAAPAAVRSTTPPTGAGPPTATTGTRRGATRTRASASSSPPPPAAALE
jgi:hypothetical protein